MPRNQQMDLKAADGFDLIKGLHQRSMYQVLSNIFDRLLRDEVATLISASQVSTIWHSILEDSLRKAFLRRVDSDPISRMIYRRWEATKENFPHVVEAETNGDYNTLYRLLGNAQERIQENRRKNLRRIRQIDLRPFLVERSQFSSSRIDDRLAVVVTNYCDHHIHFLVFDCWTLALKHRLVKVGVSLGLFRTVRWNDRFLAALFHSELTVWDLGTGQLVFTLQNDSPLLMTNTTQQQHDFSDLVLNCNNVLIVTMSNGKDSQLFSCRLDQHRPAVADENENPPTPPKIHVVNFPSVSCASLFDADRELMILQLRDGDQSIKPTNLLRVQVRSIRPPFELINEKESVNLFLKARIFDRFWLLVGSNSSTFEIWNFRTGACHELVPKGDQDFNEALYYLSYKCEIVTDNVDAKDQRRQLKLEELLPPNLFHASDIRLAPNTTSCVWWRDFLSIYLKCNLPIQSPVLEITDYCDL